MALTLNLTSEIEQYLSQKATEKGLSLEAYVLKLLMITEEILARSQQIETAAKIKGVDALHIACAEAIEADYFIICDDRMIKRYSGSLAVKTPVEFVAIIFNA